MAAVREGQRLYDDAGVVCRVVFATPVMRDRPCFRLRFDDGEEIVADRDHRWLASIGGAAEGVVDTGRIRAARLRGERCRMRACRPLRDTASGDATRLLGIMRKHGHRIADSWIVRGDAVLLAELVALARRLGLVPRRAGDDAAVLVSLRREARWRDVVSVEAVASVPVRCIQVDSPSRLFLCGQGLLPTHNTFLMAEELRRAARLAVRRGIGPENEIWYGAPTFLQA
ncbi:MAG: hypothetical protein INR65_01955, partial [Gluconacetobacter diazotrophicus]|nr:hypothetical protein [Gluconacetobacter diazotrophicus]